MLQWPSDFLPMTLGREGSCVFINAGGLSEKSQLTVEIMDKEFKPIQGFTVKECDPIRQSGFRQQATWKGKASLPAFPHAIRVRVVFGGDLVGNIKLYAIYVANE